MRPAAYFSFLFIEERRRACGAPKVCHAALTDR
jgi:hypothetical protein